MMRRATTMPPQLPPTAENIAERFPALAAHLDLEGLSALAEALDLVFVHAGDELLSQGSPVPVLHLLWEGAWALQLGDEKDAAELGALPRNTIVGEVAFFDGGPVTATIRALSRVSYALALRADAFDALAADNPRAAAGFHRAVAETLSGRLRIATDLFEQATRERGGERPDGRSVFDSIRALFGLGRSA
jgi:CRP-like cAMP-binding protein